MRKPYRLRQARPRAAIVLADGPTRPGEDYSPSLDLTDGVPRIRRLLEQAARFQVKRAVVVVGCDAVRVTQTCSQAAADLPLSVISLRNPYWASRGSMASLAQVHAWEDDPVLLLDGGVDFPDFEVERVLSGQTDMTVGIYGFNQGNRQVGVAVCRGRSWEWLIEASRTALRLNGGVDPWWRLLNGSRGGLSLATIRLAEPDDTATPVYLPTRMAANK